MHTIILRKNFEDLRQLGAVVVRRRDRQILLRLWRALATHGSLVRMTMR